MKQNTIENSKNLIYEHCDKLTDNLNSKIRQIDIMVERICHLEQMIEIFSSVYKDYNPDFESYNHKTKRNKNGNLVTYYIK